MDCTVKEKGVPKLSEEFLFFRILNNWANTCLERWKKEKYDENTCQKDIFSKG